MPFRHMPPRVTPPCPARRRHNTISHRFPDYLLIVPLTGDQVGVRHLDETEAQTADAANLDEVRPNGQVIGQIGRGGVIFGPNASLPNAVFNLGSEKDHDGKSRKGSRLSRAADSRPRASTKRVRS